MSVNVNQISFQPLAPGAPPSAGADQQRVSPDLTVYNKDGATFEASQVEIHPCAPTR